MLVKVGQLELISDLREDAHKHLSSIQDLMSKVVNIGESQQNGWVNQQCPEMVVTSNALNIRESKFHETTTNVYKNLDRRIDPDTKMGNLPQKLKINEDTSG